jgi:hypothetical protein
MADGPLALLLVLRTGLRRTWTQTPRPPRFPAGVVACGSVTAAARLAPGRGCTRVVVRFAVRAGSRVDKGAARRRRYLTTLPTFTRPR